MVKIDNPKVAAVFDAYPSDVRCRLFCLRQMVFDVADAHDEISSVEETLKWGEPSYHAKGGSPIRLGAPASPRNSYAMYFNCNTRLVDTFREIYPSSFEFEGNRALVFSIGDPIESDALMHCIELALQYHSIKNLPLLGA